MTQAATNLIPVARTDQIPAGWALAVQVGPRRIAIVNDNGVFRALDGECTHAAGPLADARLIDEGCLECPWHNSRFDVRTGEAVCGPARRALTTYPTSVDGDVVYIALN